MTGLDTLRTTSFPSHAVMEVPAELPDSAITGFVNGATLI